MSSTSTTPTATNYVVPSSRVRHQPEPDLECPICAFAEESPRSRVLVELWGTNAIRSGAKRRYQVREVLKEFGSPWGIDEVLIHNELHYSPQPVPSKAWIRDNFERVSDKLANRDRDLDLITFVGQVGLISVSQAAAWKWKGSSPDAIKRLIELSGDQLLVKVKTKNTRKGSDRTLFYLGPMGEAILNASIEQHSDSKIHEIYKASQPAQLVKLTTEHNLSIGECFLRLQKDDPDLVLSGKQVCLYSHPENIWASNLAMKTLVPGYSSTMIVPDGFAAFSVAPAKEGRRDPDPGRQIFLPFLFEYDSGSRGYDEIGEQIANYQLFARTGSVGARFPELHVPGYFVPLIFATDLPSSKLRAQVKGNTDTRVVRTVQEARAKVKEMKLGYKVPVFICSREDVKTKGLMSPCFDLAQAPDSPNRGDLAGQKTLLERLAIASKPIQNQGLDHDTILQINPSGAQAKGPNPKFSKSPDLSNEGVSTYEKLLNQEVSRDA